MASKGLNKVLLVGNLGADPETRYQQSGTAVTNITLATSDSWKDKNTGENQERTEWHKVSFFGRLAEVAGEYLKKGSKVYIEGKLQTRKWTDKDGNDRWSTDIVSHEMQMLDSKAGGQEQQQATPQQYAKGKSEQTSGFAEEGDFDQEIPF